MQLLWKILLVLCRYHVLKSSNDYQCHRRTKFKYLISFCLSGSTVTVISVQRRYRPYVFIVCHCLVRSVWGRISAWLSHNARKITFQVWNHCRKVNLTIRGCTKYNCGMTYFKGMFQHVQTGMLRALFSRCFSEIRDSPRSSVGGNQIGGQKKKLFLCFRPGFVNTLTMACRRKS